MENKVIMIFIDAFSSKYIDQNMCQTLHTLSKEGLYTKIEPMFAFQGIGATIFTGAWPNNTKIWAEYVSNENKLTNKSFLLQKLIEFSDLIPNDRICWDMRYVSFKLWGKKYIGTPNVIPSKIVKYFTTKLQSSYTNMGCLGNITTIFELLRKSNMTYDFLSPMVTAEKKVVNSVCEKIRNHTLPNLTLLHLSSLDAVGHKYGPTSNELKTSLEIMDENINQILTTSKENSDDVHVVIFSDHGMSQINQYLNIWEILDNFPVTVGKDFLVFLDSTMARFWFLTPEARAYITKGFSDITGGHILEKEELRQFHIDELGIEHGEIIFAVDEGIVIFPDFFRRHNPPKGMHGYAYPNDYPILLIDSQTINVPFINEENIQMIDLMPTVLELLDIPIPNTCEGVSCIQK